MNTSNALTATTSGPNRVVADFSAPYRASLAEACREHLAPRAEGAPTVVSLFAGAGGSSLGYSMAGYRELLAVEWDDDAASTFRANFPTVRLLHGDIASMSIPESLMLASVRAGELDVLDGSPPCQGFSTAGRRQLDDERNQLFREYTRFVRGFRPKVLVMENVFGMVKGKMKLVFVEILQELKACGYQVSARLMNVAYFGVPQHRHRLIFIGVRNDLAERGVSPSHPQAQTQLITFRQACYDLRGNGPDDRPLKPVVQECAKYQPNQWSTHDRVFGYVKGNLSGSYNLQWAGWDRTCGTIMKSEIALGGIVHPDRERYISLREAMRLTSFPDEFIFTDRKHGIERIGNSVPPLFMRAVAGHIRANML